MPVKRAVKVAELLKSEISNIIFEAVKDPRLGFVTITEVVLSDDLRNAKVYVSILAEDKEKKNSLKVLEHATPFIQTELGHRVRLKFLPKLHFYLDETWEKSVRIEQLLHNMHLEDSKENE